VGTGTRFVMRGGDGDQIPSPRHSLLLDTYILSSTWIHRWCTFAAEANARPSPAAEVSHAQVS